MILSVDERQRNSRLVIPQMGTGAGTERDSVSGITIDIVAECYKVLHTEGIGQGELNGSTIQPNFAGTPAQG